MKISIIGAGSWGTALAVSLSKNNHEVRLWDIDKEHLNNMKIHRENKKYLPGVVFSDKISIESEIKNALDCADIVLFSAPSQHFRSALLTASPYMNEKMIIVNVAKGIEQGTLKRLSQISNELVPEFRYVTLSGPSHAEEVGIGMPTTLVSASKDILVAEIIQDIFMSDRLRIYTSEDIVGVEVGGALKNIIALGAGISDGMGFGDNAKAAMMTRGMTEMTRLGVKLGAKPETFSGLSGMGDLIVTCTSMHSRNRRCGILIGKGIAVSEAIKEIGMVVEGIYTTEAAYELSQIHNVIMPITSEIYDVINNNSDAKNAVLNLMKRDKKHESENYI